MGKIVFRIYHAGRSVRNEQLAAHFREACSTGLAGRSHSVDVIDLSKEPALGEQHKILALPTIARLSPGPEKRVIGNLDANGAHKAFLFLTEDILKP